MKNLSEVKFVEWSRGIKKTSYDVLAVSDVLKDNFHLGNIHGLDVGGGIGAFSSKVCSLVDNCKITVVDNSQVAKENFISDEGTSLEFVDVFSFPEGKKYDFIFLRTVLHHFIAESDTATECLQTSGLQKCKKLLKENGIIIFEENFYDPYFGLDFTGRLIYSITKLKISEKIVRKLGANTAGEGVRFRSFLGWKHIIDALELEVVLCVESSDWGKKFPFWQRIPLLCKKRYQAVLVLRNKG